MRVNRGRANSPFIRAVLVLFAALVLAGCGGSTAGGPGAFVFTGNNSDSQVGQGAVTFNFVKVQTPLEVPNSTTTIDFRFYDGPNGAGTVVQTETRDFAPTITIDPVTGASRSVVVIARSDEGYPLVQSTARVQVVPDGEFIVDFAGSDTANIAIDNFFVSPPLAVLEPASTLQLRAYLTFTNGEVLPANNVSWTPSGQATVNGSGLVTALNDGAATVTAERDGATDTANLTIGVGQILTTITVEPDAPSVTLNSQTQFTAAAVDQNGDPFPLTSVEWTVVPGTGTAMIGANSGLLSATGLGTVTVTATQGTVSDDTAVTIVDFVPSVVLDAGTLALTAANNGVPFSPNSTVMDDQANLSGGTLTISLAGTGQVLDASFADPGGAPGSVGGDGTPTLTVSLDATATPAAIEAYLQAVTISGNTQTGTGTIQVDLSDGEGNNAPQAIRAFTFFGSDITVSTGELIQDAIDQVVTDNTGVPSRIVVDSSYNLGPESLTIANDPNLTGLLLQGNNAGITAGALSFGVMNPTRNAETIVRNIVVEAGDVTIDGFSIQGNGANSGVDVADSAGGLTVTNNIITGNDTDNIHGVDYIVTATAATNVLISNNFFTGWDYGLNIEGNDPPLMFVAVIPGWTVNRNIFVMNEAGLRLVHPMNPSVTGNSFNDNDAMIGMGFENLTAHIAGFVGNGSIVSGDIASNDFTGIGYVDNYDVNTPLIANNNYWGQPGGPLVTQTMQLPIPVTVSSFQNSPNTNFP